MIKVRILLGMGINSDSCTDSVFTGIRVDGASIESESEKNSEPGLEGAVAPTLL